MKNFFNRKNIGWILTGLVSLLLIFSSFGKLSGNEQATEMFSSGNLTDWWIMMIGIGALISTLLFILPKTMKLGTLLLSAYFGGAILFHIVHPEVAHNNYLVPLLVMLFIWVTAWVRGFKIF